MPRQTGWLLFLCAINFIMFFIIINNERSFKDEYKGDCWFDSIEAKSTESDFLLKDTGFERRHCTVWNKNRRLDFFPTFTNNGNDAFNEKLESTTVAETQLKNNIFNLTLIPFYGFTLFSGVIIGAIAKSFLKLKPVRRESEIHLQCMNGFDQ